MDGKGRDLSVIRNQTDGPVSLFTHGTREGFVGVYHPSTASGTVHSRRRPSSPCTRSGRGAPTARRSLANGALG